MDHINNNTSNEKANNNHDGFDIQYDDYTPDIPATVDRRAPQLNEANSSCHCNCPCARGTANGEQTPANVSASLDVKQEDAQSDTSSTYGDEANNHDEGAEPHLIEIGDLGYTPIDQIYRSLARHNRCTCHCGLLAGEGDYPATTFNSPTASGFISPSDSASMIVEANSSSDQSMVSSQVLSICSRGSSLLEFMEGAFVQVPIFRPLTLTPEVPFTYPIELDISESDFRGFDTR